MSVTEREVRILRHTVGLKCDGTGVQYRNHYAADSGHGNWDTLQSLCERGYMVRRPNHLDEMGPSFLFHATERGQRAAGTEELDRLEDEESTEVW